MAPTAEAAYVDDVRRRGHAGFTLRQLQPHGEERQVIELMSGWKLVRERSVWNHNPVRPNRAVLQE